MENDPKMNLDIKLFYYENDFDSYPLAFDRF